jgi:hypothetical protein
LPAHQPVAKAVVDLALADALGFEPVDGLGDRFGLVETVEPVAVDVGTFTAVRLAVPFRRWLNGAHDGKPVDRGEVPVALVFGGDGHDRPGAVPHEDVVGDVERDGFAGEGVANVGTDEDASLR